MKNLTLFKEMSVQLEKLTIGYMIVTPHDDLMKQVLVIIHNLEGKEMSIRV